LGGGGGPGGEMTQALYAHMNNKRKMKKKTKNKKQNHYAYIFPRLISHSGQETITPFL
jgi:hypothetical protein